MGSPSRWAESRRLPMSLPVSKEQFTFVIWSNEYLDWDN